MDHQLAQWLKELQEVDLITKIPLPIFLKDTNSIFVGCNLYFAKLAGLSSPEDIIGKSDYDMPWSREESECYRADDREIVKKRQSKINFEETQITSKGKKINVLSSKIPLIDNNDQVVGILGIFNDITVLKNIQEDTIQAKKQAEASRDFNQDFLTQLLERLPCPVFWKDSHGVYLGCNALFAESVGFSLATDIVGKTDYDFPATLEEVKTYRADDIEVMKNNKPKINVEETQTTRDGKKVTLLTSKVPLINKEGGVVGILGVYNNITELKNTQNELIEANEKLKETHALKIAHEKQKALLEQEEKFRKLANQVAHDIRSPLASLLMIVKSCAHIPESERIALREAAIGIGDIANHLLEQYKKNEPDSIETEESKLLLVSSALLELLTAKKYQYKKLPVKFDWHFEEHTQFVFIKTQVSAFKRMVSNLINNAVDALEGANGTISLHLTATDEVVTISIQDTGKGMPPELIAKIMNKISITAGKKDGHGIGLTQVWETLDQNQGEMHIVSKAHKGTTITLTFPKMEAPEWICEKIILNDNDLVIILDDDASIHGAWQTRFEKFSDKKSTIKRKHFTDGKEALDFIHALSAEEKEHVILLSDYELLKQELNGLHIIAQSGISRSILVTSHYADPLIQGSARKTCTKILPKQLAPEVPIQIMETTQSIAPDNIYDKVDMVIVEDNETLSNNFACFLFDDRIVDQYLKPEDLLENLHRYAKDTKIYLDNNYDNSWLKGVDIAKELHEQGYTRLYLLSGEAFEKGQLPDY